MTTTFNWRVLQLETQLGDQPHTIVHWDCTGELNGITGRAYGANTLPTGDDVPPVAELTEELTLELCWAEDLDKDAYEAVVQNQIDHQRNTELGLTWDTSLTHENYRDRALAKIDAIHADIMTKQTGNKTQPEIASWPTKSAAAKFVHAATDEELEAAISLTLSKDPAGNEDLMVIIGNVGSEVTDIRAQAAKIIPKSVAYKRLIGLADRMRDEAKEAVIAATAPEVPLEDVPAALEAVEAQILAQVQTALAEWQAGSNG